MTLQSPPSTVELDRIEFLAYDDVWAAAGAATRDVLGLVRGRVGELRVVGCRAIADAPMLNRVMGAGHTAFDPADLAAAVGLLHDRGCVSQVSVRDDDPAGPSVRGWLADQGFGTGYGWMKFLHDGESAAGPAAAGASSIRSHICTTRDRGDFGRVIAEAYGLPTAFAGVVGALVGRDGWSCFIARGSDGRAIGGGTLFFEGSTAWIGLGATIPSARGLGAQGALLRTRIGEARRRGCGLIVTETGERVPDRPSASYRNLLRAGFVEHGLRANFVAAPER